MKNNITKDKEKLVESQPMQQQKLPSDEEQQKRKKQAQDPRHNQE